VELAGAKAQLADVDMDIADLDLDGSVWWTGDTWAARQSSYEQGSAGARK